MFQDRGDVHLRNNVGECKTVLWTANQYKGDVCSVEIPSEFF